ncbi:hypothetical protein [Phycicoccus sonneratiae]|uniref:Antitoxin VbhA domain-containing protein n=1 Tax=Phycicoccus sonneratiae TaxID=2807628 RepID=A0ABS2CRA0_9MICO|nr:hypothetical protein [Phycicoccus sonneraticus]MBM6402360.1 hypothetical protein [Phycicoccus sonneraticus]
MTSGSIVLESTDRVDDRTHAIAAAQLRGEARAAGRRPRELVRAIASELEHLGMRPNLPELTRRYRAGESRLPQHLAEASHA